MIAPECAIPLKTKIENLLAIPEAVEVVEYITEDYPTEEEHPTEEFTVETKMLDEDTIPTQETPLLKNAAKNSPGITMVLPILKK